MVLTSKVDIKAIWDTTHILLPITDLIIMIKIKKNYLLSKVLEQIFCAFLLSKSFCKPASNIYSVNYMDNTFFLALKKRFCRKK